MMTDREARATNAWGFEAPLDPRCEWCDRSVVSRFGGEHPAPECDSCRSDWQRELRASGGFIEVAQ